MKILSFFALLLLVGCSKTEANPESVPDAEPMQTPQQRFDEALKKSTYGKDEKAGKYYYVRGFKMYAETYGQGEPVLMVHGNGGDISNFVMQIDYFSKNHKVIVADSRAQGKSIDKRDSLSYEMMADDLSELLRQMKIGKTDVIGWSDGGINALLLAQRHPEQVKKIAITGANVWPDATAVEPEEWSGMQKGFAEIGQKVKSGKANAADSLSCKLQKLMAENPHISKAALSKIAAPALVIGGDHDMIRPEHTLEIFRGLPNAQLWIVPNSGHATLVSFDAEFNAKIAAFFDHPFQKRKPNERFF